ncbi:hypothetical protein C8Q70DRAFT_983387 [Cubamyces menziesii]|nr:hypothetical protein C8Q70DRAFT_983387 [Cubamyces menziesii]
MLGLGMNVSPLRRSCFLHFGFLYVELHVAGSFVLPLAIFIREGRCDTGNDETARRQRNNIISALAGPSLVRVVGCTHLR